MSLSLIFDNNKTETSTNNNNKHAKSSDKKKINPIIENLLKDKINFKLAKNPDKVSIKPSTYKVFKSYKNGKKDKKDSQSNDTNPEDQQEKEEPAMARPKSMAEAVANYTGKKYNKDAPKDAKQSKKRKNDSVDQKERLKKLLLEQSSASATPTPQPETQESEQPQDDDAEDGDEDDADKDADDDDDEDDDEDFHTAESEDNAESSTSGGESGSEESSNSNTPASEAADDDDEEEDEEIDEGSKPSDSIDPLKKDLKDNVLENDTNKQEHQSAETPPTSNNDEDDEKSFRLISNNLKNSDFYDLNELPHNHGSNHSDKIDKSWGAFIENHTSLGLLNHGVTCYMNAAVQSLCHIPSLTHYLIDVQNGKYDDTIKPDSVTKVLASTICKMYRIGHNRKTMYINPKKLCKRLEDINCMMSEWQQEDSHEYFMSLMSRLQEDSTPNGVKLNQSIIYDIFGGLLEQTVTCNNCGHISTTQQEFYDLSLSLDSRKKRTSLMVDPTQLYQLRDQIEGCNSSTQDERDKLSKILNQRILLAQESNNSVSPEHDDNDTTTNNNNTDNSSRDKGPQSQHSQQQNNQQVQSSEQQQPSKKYSIEKSIRDFFTPEILKTDKRDQSGYVCEKCNTKTNAIKISTIQRSPETLSIHLKRFKFEGQQSQKVKANVQYPEILDLTSFTTDMSTPTRYKLTSVIVHQGRSVSSGHYVAHCRQPDGTWATYDDEYINKIPRASALTESGAYVLIYERLTYKGLEEDKSNEDVKNDLTTKKRKRGNAEPVTASKAPASKKNKKRK